MILQYHNIIILLWPGNKEGLFTIPPQLKKVPMKTCVTSSSVIPGAEPFPHTLHCSSWSWRTSCWRQMGDAAAREEELVLNAAEAPAVVMISSSPFGDHQLMIIDWWSPIDDHQLVTIGCFDGPRMGIPSQASPIRDKLWILKIVVIINHQYHQYHQ